jgi:hypothetical protein
MREMTLEEFFNSCMFRGPTLRKQIVNDKSLLQTLWNEGRGKVFESKYRPLMSNEVYRCKAFIDRVEIRVFRGDIIVDVEMIRIDDDDITISGGLGAQGKRN